MWGYPWDLLDEGVETVAERLTNMGITELNLATHYHSVQAFLPHNPERRTFFADSSTYFQPDDRYTAFSPVTNEEMGADDWVATICDRLKGSSLSINSWTIGCHNTRLGQQHPRLTQTNAHGDDLVYALCPTNPDVRTYFAELLSDLDTRGEFGRIELESFDYFYGTGFGWHHDKYHAELGELGEFLYGICFCDHCVGRGRNAGIDVDRARAAARTGLDDIISGDVDGNQDRRKWLRTKPALEAYVDHRELLLPEFYATITEGIDAELGYYLGLLDVADNWVHGTDLDAMAEFLDYMTVITYESNREDAVEALETAETMVDDTPLHAGVLPGHPVVHDEETVVDIVAGLDEFGVNRVSFYNYGLLPERNLSWIQAAIDQV